MRATLALLTACVLLGSPLALTAAAAAPTSHHRATVHAKKKTQSSSQTSSAKHRTTRKSQARKGRHRGRAARRGSRPAGRKPPNLVGLLLPLSSGLAQTVDKKPGTITVVHQVVGQADFMDGHSPQFNTLTGIQIDMAGGGAGASAVGYFGVTVPPETELTDFNLVQALPPMLNTATGRVEQYGQFIARTDITNPAVWAKLGKDHAARVAAQHKRDQQRRTAQQKTAGQATDKHKKPAPKHLHGARQLVSRPPVPSVKHPTQRGPHTLRPANRPAR